MWAALVRTLIGGAAGRAAGGGGLAGVARGLMGKAADKVAGLGATQAAPQTAGQAALKPKIDYGGLMGQMGNPLAYQEEKKRAWRDYTQEQRDQRQQSERGGTQGEQLNQMAEQAGEVAKGFANIVGEVTGVKDGLEGIAKVAKGDVVGALKSFGTAAMKAATATFTVPRAIGGMVESMLEKRRELSKYDGQSLGAFARLDNRKTILDIGSGQARGQSTAGLADALGDLREAIRPAEDSLAILAARFGTVAAKFATVVAKIDPITKLLGVIAGNTKKDTKDSQLPLAMFLDVLGDPAAGGRPRPMPGKNPGQRRPLPPLRGK